MAKESCVMETVSVEAKGILFDMDGVLISSIGSVERCWRVWAKMYGVPDAENFTPQHGVRAIETVKLLRPDIDPNEGVRVIEQLELEDTADLKVLPGVRKLLASIPHDRWLIVTSATRRLLLGRLAAAELPVPDRLISGDDVVNGKPDPEPYRKGAAVLGLRPEDCIVIEDAPSGVGAGLAAGCRVLGVLGTHSAKELHKADWVVPTLENLSVTATQDGLTLRFTPAE